MTDTGALPGTVDWSGENSLMSLKEAPFAWRRSTRRRITYLAWL